MGINIVLNNEFMFLAPLQKPILTYNGIYDLYLPPFSYIGFIHRPLLKFVWPDTIYEKTLLDDSEKILEVMRQCGEK